MWSYKQVFIIVSVLTAVYCIWRAVDWLLSNQTVSGRRLEVHDFTRSILSVSDRMDCVATDTSPPIRVCVYPAHLDVYVSSSLLHTGHWEGHITRQIVQHMQRHPQAGFLDLGANIGEFKQCEKFWVALWPRTTEF